MSNLRVSAYGRLAKDPETRPPKNGKNMALCSMAVDATPYNAAEDGQETVWFSLVAFGKQAEVLARHQKGEMVAITGDCTQNRWQGQDGNERTGLSVTVDSLVSSRTVRPTRKPKPTASGESFDDDLPEW